MIEVVVKILIFAILNSFCVKKKFPRLQKSYKHLKNIFEKVG